MTEHRAPFIIVSFVGALALFVGGLAAAMSLTGEYLPTVLVACALSMPASIIGIGLVVLPFSRAGRRPGGALFVGDRVIAGRHDVAEGRAARAVGLMGADLSSAPPLFIPGEGQIHMLAMRGAIVGAWLGSPDADGTREVIAVRRVLPWVGFSNGVAGSDGILECPSGTVIAPGERIRGIGA